MRRSARRGLVRFAIGHARGVDAREVHVIRASIFTDPLRFQLLIVGSDAASVTTCEYTTSEIVVVLSTRAPTRFQPVGTLVIVTPVPPRNVHAKISTSPFATAGRDMPAPQTLLVW